MDTAVISQLVTGVATLIVASVLIWQMILQRKLLQIAHSDADNNLSIQAIAEKDAIRRWSAEKMNPDMLKKLDDGIRNFFDSDALSRNNGYYGVEVRTSRRQP